MSDSEGRPGVIPELAVIIPTKNRQVVLMETLTRLLRFAGDEALEVLVVDDGSDDGSADAAEGLPGGPRWRFAVIRQSSSGPAAARNRGARSATAATCLFLGDDTLPGADLIRAHLEFHRRLPEPTDAMLGRVVPAPPLDSDPLQVWLHEQGAQFGYGRLTPGAIVSPACFWTANVSVKRDFLIACGGFDEGFPGAACEDAELGFRLARAGMRLTYEPLGLAEHFHPTNLGRTFDRMRIIGVAMRRLCELAPEMPEPSPPGFRHRVRATGLAAALALTRSHSVREASWQFLCDEALREAYHSRSTDRGEGSLRIGRALHRLTRNEDLANPSLPALPNPG